MLQNCTIITANGRTCVTVFRPTADNPIVTTDDTNPAFEQIVNAIVNEDGYPGDELVALFDTEAAARSKFERTSVTERISVKNGQVYFDNAPIDSALTKQMLAFMDEGVDDWEALALFMEKVETNPNEHSKTQLYEWLRRHDVAINAEGDCVFYKGVEKRSDGSLVSVKSGPAVVNGVEVTGQVPNEIGDVVEMDRTQVKHDPRVGCASGLHVANWRYANSWARGAVLKVLVNPRDVVSVPTESSFEKVRCSRYKVVEVVDAPYNTAYLPLDGIDVPDYEGDPADFDLDGGDGAAAVFRMGIGTIYSTPTPARADARHGLRGQAPSSRAHGHGGPTSAAAKGTGRHPAQDDKGRFSAGRPASRRDSKGRFCG